MGREDKTYVYIPEIGANVKQGKNQREINHPIWILLVENTESDGDDGEEPE
jgi:hypothetical protein